MAGKAGAAGQGAGPLLKKALARHRKGQYAEAEALYQRVLKREPDNFDALQLLGAVLLARGRYAGAERRLQAALQRDAGKADVWCNLGLARRALGQPEAAMAAFERALHLQPDFAMAHYHLGVAAAERHQPIAAADYLETALRLDPLHYPSLARLADCRRQLGAEALALDLYRRMLALRPAEPQATLGMALCLQRLQRSAQALELLQGLLERDPDCVDGWVAAAECREQRHDFDGALDDAERALALDPRELRARVIKARVLRRQGQDARAAELAGAAAGGDAGPRDALAALHTERGLALDRLGRHAEAMAAFDSANRLMLEYAAERGIDSGPSLALLARLEHWSGRVLGDSADSAGWAPVLFCGFPRSGTTLMEQILSQAEGVVGSDELPVLADLAQSIAPTDDGDPGYPAQLDALGPSELEVLRGVYRDTIVDRFGRAVLDGVFVDKLPLNTWFLPLALRLFPAARVVFAVRDPRDVCLSCYIQMFQPNQTMLLFNRLDTTVQTYCRTLRLWWRYREQLGGRALEYRYEDLVSDFDATTRRVFGFLGLPWHPGLREFHRAARDREVSTPSYEAVSRPLSDRAVGRWRCHAASFEPFAGELAPFLAAYGYPEA